MTRRIFELSDHNAAIEVTTRRPTDHGGCVVFRQLSGPALTDDEWEAFVRRLSAAYREAGGLREVDLTGKEGE